MREERTSRRDMLVALSAGAGALVFQGLSTGCATPADDTHLVITMTELQSAGRLVRTVGAQTIELTLEGTSPVARSLVCPHAGCIVRWAAGQERYLCPCQGGVFDAQGQPIAGPPTSPLVRLPVTVVGDQATVRVTQPRR